MAGTGTREAQTDARFTQGGNMRNGMERSSKKTAAKSPAIGLHSAMGGSMRWRVPMLSMGVLLLQPDSIQAKPKPRAEGTDTYAGLERRAAVGPKDDILIIQTSEAAKGFKLSFHEKLSAMKDPECTASIDRAHWMQDIFLQYDSAVH